MKIQYKATIDKWDISCYFSNIKDRMQKKYQLGLGQVANLAKSAKSCPGSNNISNMFQIQNQKLKHTWWTFQKWKQNKKINTPGQIIRFAQ